MIYVIGIGPGSRNLMTEEAIAAIEDAEVIVGYKTYINLITEFIGDKEVVQNGMREVTEPEDDNAAKQTSSSAGKHNDAKTQPKDVRQADSSINENDGKGE